MVISFQSCRKDKVEENGDVDLTGIGYNPSPYDLEIPDYFPSFQNPEDNPLTIDGIKLGQHLFYDPILSLDSTVSCASCHHPDKAFTDGLAVSKGVDNLEGSRSSMSIVNAAYAFNGLFWDGRSLSLEDQAIEPVENPLELIEDWENVEEKLRRNPTYHVLFRKAFGIKTNTEITRDLAAKSLSQFQRIIISSNSKFDRVEYSNNAAYTNEELDGRDMFFDADPLTPDAECAHCHSGALLSSQKYFNNGIEQVADLSSFPDNGRGDVSGILFENGKFRAPSLRNIALTAPYMHDGRFKTLEEVLDHYNSGGHFSENLDPLIMPLGLNEKQKDNIIQFLKTMTDTSYLSNELIIDPFQ